MKSAPGTRFRAAKNEARCRVIVEVSAWQDIAETHLWLAERSPDAAERWFDSLYDTIGSLELFP